MCDFLFYEHFLTNVCTLGEIGLLNVTQKCSTHNKFLPNFIVQVGALWLQLLKNELHFCNGDKFNPNATNFNPIDTRSPIVQWVRAIRNIFRVRIEHLLKRFFKQPVWNGEDGNFYVKSRILLFKVMTRSTLQPLSVSFFKCWSDMIGWSNVDTIILEEIAKISTFDNKRRPPHTQNFGKPQKMTKNYTHGASYGRGGQKILVCEPQKSAFFRTNFPKINMLKLIHNVPFVCHSKFQMQVFIYTFFHSK